jgi:hypothetical protein
MPLFKRSQMNLYLTMGSGKFQEKTSYLQQMTSGDDYKRCPLGEYIETMEEIAKHLNISERQTYRLASPNVVDSLSKILLEKIVRKRCQDGKVRRFRIKYTLQTLLDMWQWKRGGLRAEKREE